MKRFISVAALSLSLLQSVSICSADSSPVATPFSYIVPPGGLSRTIRIMHVASGTPRLVHMGLHKAGEVIKLDLAAWDGDRVQIMINGIMKEELPVELPKPALATPATLAASPTQPIATTVLPATAAAPLAIVPASAPVFPVEPAGPLPASPVQRLVEEKPRRIVTGTAVRLRESPSVTAAEVAKLALGTIADELEIGTVEEKIGSRTSRWYRIALPDGRSGWIFGGFTLPFSAGDRDATFIRLARERLAFENLGANELLELHQLLRSAVTTAATDQSRAVLEFHALLALNRCLRETCRDVKLGTMPPSAAPYAGELVYSEPAGMYMVKYTIFWDLYEKLKEDPLADELAWEASKQPIPGETEGFFDLLLTSANETDGRYLRAQPTGAHVSNAFDDINNCLFASQADGIMHEPADIPEEELKQRLQDESRQEALDALESLRTAVDKTGSTERGTVMERLDGLAERIRKSGK